MKKIKIGIPRALLYYRYGVLWKTFFTNLGCNVILSPETNQNIIDLGKNNTIDECCLSYKIYIGHAVYLKDKCDYLFLCRICDYGKQDKVCTRFNGIYDDIKSIIQDTKILSYNIEHTKFQYEFSGFIKMGLKLTKNIFKIIYSYIIAKKKQQNYNLTKQNEQIHNLKKNNPKILIITHSYNIGDQYLANYMVDYLEKHNITIIYSNYLDYSLAASFSEYFSDTLYWKYSKEAIGALYYYRHQINGIIYFSTYPCGIDALVNNLSMYKNNYLPTLNLIVDEYTSPLNLETKLESFLDIIGGNHE